MAVLNMTTMAITNMTTMHDRRNQLNTESSQIMDSTGQKCPKVPPKDGYTLYYTRMVFLLGSPFLLHDTLPLNATTTRVQSISGFKCKSAGQCAGGGDGLMLSNGWCYLTGPPQRINRISIYQTLQHKLCSWNTEIFWGLTNVCAPMHHFFHPGFNFSKINFLPFFKISSKHFVLFCSRPLMCGRSRYHSPTFHPAVTFYFSNNNRNLFKKFGFRTTITICLRNYVFKQQLQSV